MKTKVNRLLKQRARAVNRCMFDVAAAPMFLVIFGVPIFLGLIVVCLVYFAVKKIRQISREKNTEKDGDNR